jgi:hypothetical protein
MGITVFERRRGRDDPPAPPRTARLLLDRRRFIGASLTAVGAYVAAHGGLTWIVGPNRAWAMQLDAFEPELAETLLHMTRALYPHDFLGDVYYAKVVQDLDAEAAGFDDKERLQMLRDGMLALNEAAGGTFTSANEERRAAALEEIAGSPFFAAVRGKTIVSLYNQPEVWAQFGYEGPSFERGGYLFNGFNDLSWLPDPPPEASPPVQL